MTKFKFFLAFCFCATPLLTNISCTQPEREPAAFEGRSMGTNSIIESKSTGELLVSINEDDFRNCSVALTKVGDKKFECVLKADIKTNPKAKMISDTQDFNMFSDKNLGHTIEVHLRPDHLKVNVEAESLDMARRLLNNETPKTCTN